MTQLLVVGSRVSVVVPVFCSERTLVELHRRLVKVFDGLRIDFEIVFVEDCGNDASWSVIQELAQQDARVCGLHLARNYGQHNALLCGIRQARGDIIVTLDDDLQNPPEEIPRLLAKLNEGFDVVYGTPEKETHGFLRDLTSRITKLTLQGAMGANIAAKVGAYRAFRTSLREAFKNYQSSTVNIDVLLTWGTARFTAIKVRQDKRAAGESGYTLRKLIRHAFNMMTGFSVIPLQVASLLGFVFSLFGFLILVYVVIRYLINGSAVPGFPFLASIIAIFSGVQLFALGIIGEYLARIHFRSMDRPAYVVAETIHPRLDDAPDCKDSPATGAQTT